MGKCVEFVVFVSEMMIIFVGNMVCCLIYVVYGIDDLYFIVNIYFFIFFFVVYEL